METCKIVGWVGSLSYFSHSQMPAALVLGERRMSCPSHGFELTCNTKPQYVPKTDSIKPLKIVLFNSASFIYTVYIANKQTEESLVNN